MYQSKHGEYSPCVAIIIIHPENSLHLTGPELHTQQMMALL